MTQQVVKGKNFECRVENGYIYNRVWGKVPVREAEASTAALIDMAKQAKIDKILIDVHELSWISDLSLRLRGMELFFEGSKYFKHVALVSSRPAIIYLVTILAKGGGLDSKSFDEADAAATWLRSRG